LDTQELKGGGHEHSDSATIAFKYSYTTGNGIFGQNTYLTPLSSSYAPRIEPTTTTTTGTGTATTTATAAAATTATTASNTFYDKKFFYDDSTAYLIPALNVVYSVTLEVSFDSLLCKATSSLITTWYVEL
jgi:hypothetical protein